MTQLDPVYILKLLKATKMFTSKQKAEIKQKLPELSGLKIAELQIILEKEQKIKAKHHRRIGEVRVKAAERKVKTIYNYAEKEIEREEHKMIADLDQELAALES